MHYWIAQDEDGGWYTYNTVPFEGKTSWRIINKETVYPGTMFIGQSDPNPEWKDTLRKVEI